MKGAGWPLIIRRVLLVIVAVLALLTAYQFYRVQPAYQLRLFKTPTGWGYDVLNRDKLLIHQPIIPGVAGEQGFVDETQARRVGERVISKIRQGQGMPAITQQELREMQVATP